MQRKLREATGVFVANVKGRSHDSFLRFTEQSSRLTSLRSKPCSSRLGRKLRRASRVQPTFFTRDFDYFDARLCHRGCCLICLNVRPDEAAVFIRRFLRHPDFRTHLQRLGRVIRVHTGGIDYWQRGQRQQTEIAWD